MTNPAELRSATPATRGLLAFISTLLILTVLAACGPSGGTEPPPEGDTSVQVTVTGPGRVVQGDFVCTCTCTWTGNDTDAVTFQAVPSTGNVLVAWGGVCPALAETCTRTFADGDEVTVAFAPNAVRLDLTGDGEGLFRVAGGGVNATCDADCGVAVDGTLQLAVTYEAEGTRGTTLGDWTGACAAAPLNDYCLVTASGATNVGKTWRHPPVATSDGYTTWRNAPLSVDAADGVLANDTDTPGDPLTATVAQDAPNGTLTLRPDGSFDYEPTDGFEGQDGFTYRVQDAFGNEATANVTIAVVDRVPAAADDAYATTRNAALIVDAANGVLENDVDPDGDPLTAVLESDVSGGTLTLASDGSFTYAPNPDFVGTDSFTYRASDGATTGNLATVTIAVTNGVPGSVADAYDTPRNATLTVPAVDGVLANDTDPDGDPLTAVLVEDVGSGTLTLAPDGSFEYVPAAGFVGTATFTYVADDGVDASPTTTVTIDVTNTAPTAVDGDYVTDRNETLVVGAVADGVLSNDTDAEGDALVAVLASGVSDGALTLDADGTFEYVPDTGFVGTDTFTYQADDGEALSAAATVTITVDNGAPVAAPDAYSVVHDTTLTVLAPGVLDNDDDPNGDPITAVLVEDVDDGTLTLDDDGSFQYVPDAGFVGTDSFSYQADDGVATSATATVTITVTNQAPTASPDSYDVLHDTTLTVAAPGVLDNDGDADGVTITVTNQAPEATADSYDAVQGVQLSVTALDGVLANDSDPDGEALTASLV